jgi:hypothetical protein
MKLKASVFLSTIGVSTVALFSTASVVQAKSPTDWTCSDFLQVPKSAQPQVVYWMEGFHKGGSSDAVDATAETFKRPIAKVVEECRKNKPENLWDAIVQHFYARAKAIP